MASLVAIITFLCYVRIITSLRNRSDYRVVRLQPITEDQIAWVDYLRRDPSLDFWSVNDVMVDSARERTLKLQLKEEGISSRTIISNVQTIIDAEKVLHRGPPTYRQDTPISFDKYHRPDEIFLQLQNVAKKYEKVASLREIGRSSQNRPILLIVISSGGNGTRPLIIIDGGAHAREWLSPATALFIIQELSGNPRNADLIASVDWHIIPLMNPDGYEYSHTDNRLWRKNRSSQDCKDDNQSGVDLNRNYDFHWKETGASSSPCNNLYAGPFAFSELESRALRDHVTENSARTRLYITLHTFGQLLMYPWGYTRDLPADWRRLDEVATRATHALGHGSWTVGSSGSTLYTAAGGSDDWVKGVAGVPLTYTVELEGDEPGGFIFPAESLQGAVESFFPAVRVFGEHVAHPYYSSGYGVSAADAIYYSTSWHSSGARCWEILQDITNIYLLTIISFDGMQCNCITLLVLWFKFSI